MIYKSITEKLVVEYQQKPDKLKNNIMLLWDDIGKIIIGSFHKKWLKWSVLSPMSWEDSKRELLVGFIEAIKSYDSKGSYEVGKWLYLKTMSYGTIKIVKMLNNKNKILNNYVHYDDTNINLQSPFMVTNDLNDEIIEKIDYENKLKAIRKCLSHLSKQKENITKMKILKLKFGGLSLKIISEIMHISEQKVKNDLFSIKKKIKKFLQKDSPEVFK